MHLCAFLIAGPVGHSHAQWRNPHHEPGFLTLAHYRRIAETLERGKFDFLFFADRLGISDRFGGDLEVGVRYGDQDATRLDPVPLLGALAASTTHIGLGATRSTSYDQPYHIAREFATLDHLSGGRAAWNVVTSMNDGEALNFGVAQHLEHDARYDRADEFVELACELWNSWDPGALVLDRENGVYADPDRVHYVRHEGAWFSSRGPLNIPRSPQGRPVIIQAGSSGRGKKFAARWAEVVFTIQQTPELMKRFSDDVRASLAAFDRPPQSCKILTAVMPFVADTAAQAEEERDAHNAMIHPLVGLSTLASHSNFDFSTLPLDQPIREATSRGTQGMFETVMRITRDEALSLADVGTLYGRSVLVPQIAGTASDVADYLESIVTTGAADGFVVSPAFLPDSLDRFVDGVVPELQRRGLFRREYGGPHLRDHLDLPPL
ncbi:MAG: FMN-dependent monooxygenase [Candidatus Eremiobacteraeota bacterium]|nr:FMN-dependent monooxygenase [Candidatus Eremiobacteraeota bacterium]